MDIRSHVVALNEQRARVVSELRAELDATAGRERNQEETTKIQRLDARIDELDAEVREFVTRETREQEAAVLREQTMSVFGEATTVRAELTADQMLRNWAQTRGAGAMEINIRGAQREREMLRQGASVDEIRALAWDTGSSASLVPTTLARTLYEYMEASNGLLRAPTTKLTTASGENLDFPRLGAHAIATQVIAQGSAVSGTDPTFAKMTLGAFKYGQLVYVANEVLADSAIDIASFLGRDMGRALGRVTATDYVTGGGSTAPEGLMTAIVGAGTIATGGSLITPTVEKLIDLQYSVNDEYRNGGSAGWLMRDSTAGTLRKLRDGAGGTIGAFLWEPSLTNGVIGGAPDRLLGHPVYTDSNVAAQGSNAKAVAFGDFSAFYIRMVGNPTVERDDSVKFAEDQAAFRIKLRTDSGLIDTTAFNALKMSVS
jgi:HK97 family phage major capsid protein